MDPKMLELLISELDISEREVFHLPGPLDLRGLFSFADVDRAELKYSRLSPPHSSPSRRRMAKPADMPAALKQRDVLLHHPYDSFATSVQRFIEQAADDPHVRRSAILYRTSGTTVTTSIEAAEAGKQVLALVEIMPASTSRPTSPGPQARAARLSRGLRLARQAEDPLQAFDGRPQHQRTRRYAHIGTGNYNPKTARSRRTSGCSPPTYRHRGHRSAIQPFGMAQGISSNWLLVAPHRIRNGPIDRINHEIANRDGKPAAIKIKVNSIVDEATSDALYRASRAGVPVDLWVRGTCTIRPGVPGLSENIRVRSILGRFLEHSRLFWFANDGSPSVGIGSDLMHRNPRPSRGGTRLDHQSSTRE